MSIQRIAVVTGGSRGIGATIALELAKKGVDIAIVYTSESSMPQAEAIKDQITALGSKAILVRADLATSDCGEVVLNAVLKGFGGAKIDILVNNAGIMGEAADSLSFSAETFQRYVSSTSTFGMKRTDSFTE